MGIYSINIELFMKKESNIGLYLLLLFLLVIIISDLTLEKHPKLQLSEAQEKIYRCIDGIVRGNASPTRRIVIKDNHKLRERKLNISTCISSYFIPLNNSELKQLRNANVSSHSGCVEPQGFLNKNKCSALKIGGPLFQDAVTSEITSRKSVNKSPLATYTVPNRSASKFKGARCTDDCSGHKAGYEWAESNGIQDAYDCKNQSLSFKAGCEIYVDENFFY